MKSQSRQDTTYVPTVELQLNLAALREEQATAEIDTRAWRISDYRAMQRAGTCDEVCQIRLERLERDEEALKKKKDALIEEQNILRGKQ